MADKTIRESFFDAKAIGSLWDVAVSLKRGNPLPIDADSVFESEAKLIEYIGDKVTTVAYPGQVVAVVNADSTQIFYIDQELNYHPVGAKLDADGKSIKVDNNVLKLVGFDEATDGLLAQVKVDAEGNRTLNWVSIETIAQGDGNTTYTFTGLDKESNVYFEVKASDAETATKIYLDAYTKAEIDAKFEALSDNDTTYTFTDGTEGKFTVTPKNGEAITVDTGAKDYVDSAIQAALEEAKKYADDNDANTVYDDTALAGRVTTLENAGHQTAEQVSTAIAAALNDYYNKETIDEVVEDLQNDISAIPKFSIEVAEADASGKYPNVENPSYTTVYLVPDNDTTTADVYDEWIYVKVSDEVSQWELLGKQTLDLSGYVDFETFNRFAEDIGNDIGSLINKVVELEKLPEEIGDVNTSLAQHANDKNIHTTPDEIEGMLNGKYNLDTIATRIDSAKDDAISSIKTTYDLDNLNTKIANAKNEAIAAALIKSVDENQFTVTEGKLALSAIAQDKVTGLADKFAGIYTKEETASKIAEVIGNKPTVTVDENGKNVYSGASGIYIDIYTKDEVTDLISSFTGGESAADVLAELNKYKSSNDARVKIVEDVIGKEAEGETPATGIIGDIAAITGNINTITSKLDTIEEGAEVNVIEGITVNGVALAITDKVVDIPAATSEKFGAVKLGSEFMTNEETDALEVKELNVNKLVQDDGDVLILDGGLASNLIKE